MATRKKKTSEDSSWEVVEGPISAEEIMDRVMDKVWDDFSKVDDRETSLLAEESQEVLARSMEIAELVNSWKKSKEWAETQEKYIRTGIRNRQSPPKKKEVKKGAKLPNTREEGVVSTVTSEKSKKPQGKATEEVKKIDEKDKMWKSEKIVQKKASRTKRETRAEKMARELIENAERQERIRKQNEERARLEREKLLLDIQEIAEKIVQKKGWQKVKLDRAAYAVYLAHPEASKITLEQLWERFGFHRNSTIHWRYREDVMKIRDFLIYEMARHYTPAVIQNLAQSASSRNPFTGLAQEGLVKLYLQVVEKWSEKTEVEHSGTVDHDIFTMDLPASQFVKKDKLPKKKGEDDDDEDE